MTKRSVETDLDDLSEAMLDDLDAKSRVALLLKAREDDRDRWEERLLETIPTTVYRGKDPEYKRRAQLLHMIAKTVFTNLYTTFLEFELVKSQNTSHALQVLLTTSDDDAIHPNVSPENEMSPSELFISLYINFYAYKRFARQIVGVDLETWLASRPAGQQVVAVVEETLETESEYFEAESQDLPKISGDNFDLSREDLPEKLPENPLDRYALDRYDSMKETFEEQFETSPLQTGHLGLK